MSQFCLDDRSGVVAVFVCCDQSMVRWIRRVAKVIRRGRGKISPVRKLLQSDASYSTSFREWKRKSLIFQQKLHISIANCQILSLYPIRWCKEANGCNTMSNTLIKSIAKQQRTVAPALLSKQQSLSHPKRTQAAQSEVTRDKKRW